MITKKIWKKLLPFALAVTCLFAVSARAMAGEIDPDRTGSVSVTIRAYASDDVVGGGSLYLYQVAGTVVTAEGEAAYLYTDNFSDCGEELLAADELAKAETADVFFDWVKTNRVAAVETVTVSAEGQAYFEGLSCGLYLVTQNEAAEGYHAINAFLVSVPLQENGVWIYDVDATPKTSPVTMDTTEDQRITQTGTQNPDGSGNAGGGGTTKGGGGRTGDIRGFLYWMLVIAAALVIVVVLCRRRNRREQ